MFFRWIFFITMSFLGKAPLYQKGAIVKDPRGRFIVLRNIRWIRPNNHDRHRKWQWVYDGIVLNIENGNISFSTGIFTMPERELITVADLS